MLCFNLDPVLLMDVDLGGEWHLACSAGARRLPYFRNITDGLLGLGAVGVIVSADHLYFHYPP